MPLQNQTQSRWRRSLPQAEKPVFGMVLRREVAVARCEHRSLNNFVECVLLDVAYNQPNEVTKAAIEEARSGKLRDAAPVDTSSAEAMFKSKGV